MKIYADSENGYDGIADEYERWCTGDDSYKPSLKFYLKYLESHSGPFLELGIGTGRIALEAIRSNRKHIVGVDISANMLKKCEEKYKILKKDSAEAGTLRLMKMRMEDIAFCEEFEVVYLPFRTVGHIMTDPDLELVFRNVYKALLPGGSFVLDHYIFQKEWAETHNDVDILMYSDPEKGATIKDHYLYDFDREVMECSVKLNETVVQTFRFRWIRPEAIQQAALRAGFAIDNVYGDFDKRDFSKDSCNQIWILRK